MLLVNELPKISGFAFAGRGEVITAEYAEQLKAELSGVCKSFADCLATDVLYSLCDTNIMDYADEWIDTRVELSRVGAREWLHNEPQADIYIDQVLDAGFNRDKGPFFELVRLARVFQIEDEVFPAFGDIFNAVVMAAVSEVYPVISQRQKSALTIKNANDIHTVNDLRTLIKEAFKAE